MPSGAVLYGMVWFSEPSVQAEPLSCSLVVELVCGLSDLTLLTLVGAILLVA